MPPKCRPDVAVARAQTERILREAEKAIESMPSVRSKPSLSGPCTMRLTSARVAFSIAGESPDPMAQRDGYIRASFQAGQALSCARVTQIGKKLGRMPAPKTKKKAEKK